MLKYIVAALLTASPVLAQDVNGTWKTETSDAGAHLEVRIGPCSYDTAKTCGVINKAVGTDNKAIVGKAIIKDMQPNGAGKWHKGTIWAPDDDKTYRSNMALSGNVLKVEGCVAVFCRGQNWTRIN
ncbi:DUF2147 domain-containing protein [Algicella marina]|uniref:DUF2147 domain-containing protein n=1 Tax=Algicella marina TaxID=2683284 RepID=A0A6P1SZF4_9RHOB|nr:DUF2147 domain-containing protein [Algicella marina]QHQ35848.1 DUF2147 domain-containing protein [Algicella marina]